MLVTGNTVSAIVNAANQHINDIGGRTVLAFPDKYFSTPLKQTMYSLGIKKTLVGPRIATTNSNGTMSLTRNRNVTVTIALNVYAPHSMGGEACSVGFDKFIDFVVRTLQINIIDAGCSEVEYDQSIGTNVLKCYFTIERTVSETTPA
ncbi:MAG: hypothetical protein K5755_03035 [Clostridiales bacterium]|nr:hypothetical protein [Clostridia bacterium]MCR4563591.1 hypothetical protein [Clostridiales bacterium]